MATYDKLRELLEFEIYPYRYTHKFIGRRTEAFAGAVAELERAFPDAVRVAERATGPRYVAYTYEILARSADEIIALWQATERLADLKLIM